MQRVIVTQKGQKRSNKVITSGSKTENHQTMDDVGDNDGGCDDAVNNHKGDDNNDGDNAVTDYDDEDNDGVTMVILINFTELTEKKTDVSLNNFGAKKKKKKSFSPSKNMSNFKIIK